MSSIYGLENEIRSLQKRLEEAEKGNDMQKIAYLKERIERVQKEIQGIKDYNKTFEK